MLNRVDLVFHVSFQLATLQACTRLFYCFHPNIIYAFVEFTFTLHTLYTNFKRLFLAIINIQLRRNI